MNIDEQSKWSSGNGGRRHGRQCWHKKRTAWGHHTMSWHCRVILLWALLLQACYSVAPFPSRYSTAYGYNGCTLPSDGYGGHGGPEPDSRITFLLLDPSTSAPVSAFLFGATYLLVVETGSTDIGFLLASSGAFSDPDTECAARRKTYLTRASEHIASWTAPPTSEIDSVTFSANFASGASQPYRQNSASFTVDAGGGQLSPSPTALLTLVPQLTPSTATTEPLFTPRPPIEVTATPSAPMVTPASTATTASPDEGECECLGGVCYCFYPSTPLSWPEAQDVCGQKGSNWTLAVPSSTQELQFLRDRMSAGQPAWWPAIFHIGASREGADFPWLTPMGQAFYLPTEEWCWLYTGDDGTSNCAYHSGLCGGVSNQQCSQPSAFACKELSGGVGEEVEYPVEDEEGLPRVTLTTLLPDLELEAFRDREFRDLFTLVYQGIIGWVSDERAVSVTVEGIRAGSVEVETMVTFPMDTGEAVLIAFADEIQQSDVFAEEFFVTTYGRAVVSDVQTCEGAGIGGTPGTCSPAPTPPPGPTMPPPTPNPFSTDVPLTPLTVTTTSTTTNTPAPDEGYCECLGSSCYCFYPSTPRSWLDAQHACAQKGTNWTLAVPSSAQELQYLRDRMSAGQPPWWPTIFHIGASREGIGSPWLTTTGQVFFLPTEEWCWLYTGDDGTSNCAYHSGLCEGVSNQQCSQASAYACEEQSGGGGEEVEYPVDDEEELPRVAFTTLLPDLELGLFEDRQFRDLFTLVYQDTVGRASEGGAVSVTVGDIRAGSVEVDTTAVFSLDSGEEGLSTFVRVLEQNQLFSEDAFTNIAGPAQVLPNSIRIHRAGDGVPMPTVETGAPTTTISPLPTPTLTPSPTITPTSGMTTPDTSVASTPTVTVAAMTITPDPVTVSPAPSVPTPTETEASISTTLAPITTTPTSDVPATTQSKLPTTAPTPTTATVTPNLPTPTETQSLTTSASKPTVSTTSPDVPTPTVATVTPEATTITPTSDVPTPTTTGAPTTLMPATATPTPDVPTPTGTEGVSTVTPEPTAHDLPTPTATRSPTTMIPTSGTPSSAVPTPTETQSPQAVKPTTVTPTPTETQKVSTTSPEPTALGVPTSTVTTVTAEATTFTPTSNVPTPTATGAPTTAMPTTVTPTGAPTIAMPTTVTPTPDMPTPTSTEGVSTTSPEPTTFTPTSDVPTATETEAPPTSTPTLPTTFLATFPTPTPVEVEGPQTSTFGATTVSSTTEGPTPTATRTPVTSTPESTTGMPTPFQTPPLTITVTAQPVAVTPTPTPTDPETPTPTAPKPSFTTTPILPTPTETEVLRTTSPEPTPTPTFPIPTETHAPTTSTPEAVTTQATVLPPTPTSSPATTTPLTTPTPDPDLTLVLAVPTAIAMPSLIRRRLLVPPTPQQLAAFTPAISLFLDEFAAEVGVPRSQVTASGLDIDGNQLQFVTYVRERPNTVSAISARLQPNSPNPLPASAFTSAISYSEPVELDEASVPVVFDQGDDAEQLSDNLGSSLPPEIDDILPPAPPIVIPPPTSAPTPSPTAMQHTATPAPTPSPTAAPTPPPVTTTAVPITTTTPVAPTTPTTPAPPMPTTTPPLATTAPAPPRPTPPGQNLCGLAFVVKVEVQVLPEDQAKGDDDDSSSSGMEWPEDMEEHWQTVTAPIIRNLLAMYLDTPLDAANVQLEEERWRFGAISRTGCTRDIKKIATFAVYLQREQAAGEFAHWIEEEGEEGLSGPLMMADSSICAARADADRPEETTCCGCDWTGSYDGPGGGEESSPPPSPPPPPPPPTPSPPLPQTVIPPIHDGCADYYIVSLNLAILPPATDEESSSSSSTSLPYWTPEQEYHFYYTTDPLLRDLLSNAMGLSDPRSPALQLATVRFSVGAIPYSGCGRGTRKFLRYDALFSDLTRANLYIHSLTAPSDGGLAVLTESLEVSDPVGVCGAYAQLANSGRPSTPTHQCIGPDHPLTVFKASSD